MTVKLSIGVIGGGNMGAAIVSGIHKDHRVFICESDHARRIQLKRKFKIGILGLKDLLDESTIVILAVKPQDFDDLLVSIKPHVRREHLFVSIAAGITTKYIEKKLCPGVRVVRTMPNLPAQIQQGVTAIASGKNALKSDLGHVQKLFNTIGTTLLLEEKYIDAVTAVSGSGPAYVFLFMECMINAAQSLGLSEKLSRTMVLETIKGSVNLLEKQKESADVLKKRVTSKGGTTQAALTVFEQENIDKIFKKALKSAKQRAGELSR
ncbi:MAG: pyrroline-5-carboxylate reductase [Candidatus Omnitrophota bacterium]